MMRLPVLPTILVAIAVVLMLRLGFWQLDRADEKAALLARYATAANKPAIAFPAIPIGDALLFRKAGGLCLAPVSESVDSGRNMAGASGWRHIVACRTSAEGPGMTVDVGWSVDFKTRSGWRGGQVTGTIASQPDHRSVIDRALSRGQTPALMLVAAVPASGLQPSAPPRLDEIPNNHLAYAVQWFLFAGIATVIYILALRRRRS